MSSPSREEEARADNTSTAPKPGLRYFWLYFTSASNVVELEDVRLGATRKTSPRHAEVWQQSSGSTRLKWPEGLWKTYFRYLRSRECRPVHHRFLRCSWLGGMDSSSTSTLRYFRFSHLEFLNVPQVLILLFLSEQRPNTLSQDFIILPPALIEESVFVVEGCPVHCGIFSSISALYPLEVSSMLSLELWQPKEVLQILSNVPWKAKIMSCWKPVL